MVTQQLKYYIFIHKLLLPIKILFFFNLDISRKTCIDVVFHKDLDVIDRELSTLCNIPNLVKYDIRSIFSVILNY